MVSESYDTQFQRIVSRILREGVDMEDRTGVGVRKVFSESITVDLSSDSNSKLVLPALTLRKVFPRVAWYELLWMLMGSTDVTLLQDKGIKIWDGNSSREFLDANGFEHVNEGHVPNAYGKQFRAFNGHVDQLMNLIDGLKSNPSSRRHMISLWNPAEVDETPLPPCHVLYQFVPVGDMLNLSFYQRSSDFILAGNQNFMFAAMFLHLIARMTDFKVGSLTHTIGDCHIYSNHLEVAEELVDKCPIDHVATYNLDGVFDAIEFEHLDTLIATMFVTKSWEHYISGTLDYKSHERIDPSRLIMAT